MNIDFQYRSIEIDKEKKLTSININDFPIEIDDDINRLLSILSIPIDCYRFC